jgi:hypothetical protein
MAQPFVSCTPPSTKGGKTTCFCVAGDEEGTWAGVCTKSKDGKTWSCKQVGSTKTKRELRKAVLAAMTRKRTSKR